MYRAINAIKNYTETELEKLIPTEASWHKDVCFLLKKSRQLTHNQVQRFSLYIY